jgi:hypothetical protein
MKSFEGVAHSIEFSIPSPFGYGPMAICSLFSKSRIIAANRIDSCIRFGWSGQISH